MTNERSSFVGGILNLTGARPGHAFEYEGLTMPGMVYYAMTFTSTHDAIEKLIVPPPLKVDRSLPPEVRVMYFINRHNLAFDGKTTPYHAVMFAARVEHNGRKASAGWEYVDGIYNDKTDVDIMGPWGVYFGMLKKMADIRFLPIAPNTFEITVDRRGIRIVTIRMCLGAELPPTSVAQINNNISSAGGQLTVREIPNTTYTGFVDRSICWTDTDSNSSITRAWAANQGAIELGHLDEDPWDELPVFGVKDELCYQIDVGKPVLAEMVVVERLEEF
jgi:hypothetical protein